MNWHVAGQFTANFMYDSNDIDESNDQIEFNRQNSIEINQSVTSINVDEYIDTVPDSD